MGIFDASLFDYNAEDDTYTQEISQLCGQRFSRMITIKSNGKNRHYRLERTDKSGDDIAGWWYYELGTGPTGKVGKVLVIND